MVVVLVVVQAGVEAPTERGTLGEQVETANPWCVRRTMTSSLVPAVRTSTTTRGSATMSTIVPSALLLLATRSLTKLGSVEKLLLLLCPPLASNHW